MKLRVRVTGLLAALIATYSLAFAADNREADSKADQLLQSMSRSLAAANSIQFKSHAVARMQAKGMLQEMSTTYAIALQRPAKLAIQSDSNFLGSTIISDGTTVTRYTPSQNTYKAEAAPSSIDQITAGSAGGIGGILRDPIAFTGQLLGSVPYETLMKNVKQLQYVGAENGTEHLHFVEDDLQWDLWLDSKSGLPARVAADLTAVMTSGAKADGPKFSGEITFEDWNLSPQLAADAFVFTPPAGAKIAREAPERPAESSRMLAKPAPDFKLPLLGGGEVELSKLKGKVVVLDFWATWCGPCRMALPLVSRAAMDLKTSGVEFFAVNLKEEKSEIEAFLKEAKLQVPVALDSDGDIAKKYDVDGIPHSVVIGKDGTLQAIHIGYSPTLKTELKQQLEELLAGKSLATTETLAKSAAANVEAKKAEAEAQEEQADKKKPKTAPDASTSRGVELAWRLDGPWTAVAADTTAGLVFSTNLKGEAVQLSADGKKQSEFKLPGMISALRLAHFGNGKPTLIGYQSWGRNLTAFDPTGKDLWSAPVAQGISEASAADLDGDSRDEILIAANGTPAVQVIKSDGTTQWQSDKLPKATHVSTAPNSNTGKLQVLASSTDGKAHDLSSTGAELRKWDPHVFATVVRATQSTSPTLYLACGTTKGGEGIAAVTADGKTKWSTPLSANARATIDAAEMSPDDSKVAVALRGGAIHILDVQSGNVIATIASQGLRPEIAWSKGPKGELMLLVATGTELQAVRLK